MASKIDLKQLEHEIQHLTRTQKLYIVLRVELSKLGHWKQRPRGNPTNAYKALLRAKQRNER